MDADPQLNLPEQRRNEELAQVLEVNSGLTSWGFVDCFGHLHDVNFSPDARHACCILPYTGYFKALVFNVQSLYACDSRDLFPDWIARHPAFARGVEEG